VERLAVEEKLIMGKGSASKNLNNNRLVGHVSRQTTEKLFFSQLRVLARFVKQNQVGLAKIRLDGHRAKGASST
jgi:hypothetical protein